MADNYLEKRMDDYRRGVLGSRRGHQSSSGYWRMKIPQLRVMIMGSVTPTVREIVRLYGSNGCKVIFCDDNNASGREISQSTGALYYPAGSPVDWEAVHEFAVDRWGGVDVIIMTPEAAEISSLPWINEGTRIISLNAPLHDGPATCNVGVTFDADGNAAAVARTVMFLSLPDNYCISGQTISIGH